MPSLLTGSEESRCMPRSCHGERPTIVAAPTHTTPSTGLIRSLPYWFRASACAQQTAGSAPRVRRARCRLARALAARMSALPRRIVTRRAVSPRPATQFYLGRGSRNSPPSRSRNDVLSALMPRSGRRARAIAARSPSNISAIGPALRHTLLPFFTASRPAVS